MNSEIIVNLKKLKLKVRDLGDDWYKVSIYYTYFDPYQHVVNFGYGDFLADMLMDPILVLYNTKEDLINGEKYETLVENVSKYVSNSPLSDFIVESISAVKSAMVWHGTYWGLEE
ncbi:unknown [Clostridium sp. CAG:440]|nr:unknown [Clostridium sp. CAG:440]